MLTAIDQVNDSGFSGRIRGDGLSPLDQARELLSLASSFSDAPISGFHVGAVAIGRSGNLYLGANMEFVGVPLSSSLHAEQSAVLNARFHGETHLEGILVSAAPCGHCRQFLWELPEAAELKLYFGEHQSDLNALLPNAFGESRAVGESLLDSPMLELEPTIEELSNLMQHAVQAARKSYVPYSISPEGVALECVNGAIFTGGTVQSVAFNPTVPAIICALNQRNFSPSRADAIGAVVYSKLATSLTGQRALTRALLRRITNAEVQSLTLEMV